jgi:hypothetical protein
LKAILNLIKHTEKNKVEVGKFILRCPTGKAAEDYFHNFYVQNQLPIQGDLLDCRDLGCGYDYKIIDVSSNEIYVEVKGISDISGGILFTDKEWKVAIEKKSKYYLCIVRNLDKNPELEFINNPSQFIKPTKNIRTAIQISWSVSDKELKSINSDF